MIFPVIIPECGHTYCKDLLVWVQNQGVAKHCSSCRTPISSELKTNFTVKKLVENLEAKCDLCQLEGKIEQLANHKCPEEEIKCENGQCSTKVKRKDQERHAEECIFKVVFCERCHRSTTVANLEIHREETCPEGETNCPLKCTKRPKRYVWSYKSQQYHIKFHSLIRKPVVSPRGEFAPTSLNNKKSCSIMVAPW